ADGAFVERRDLTLPHEGEPERQHEIAEHVLVAAVDAVERPVHHRPLDVPPGCGAGPQIEDGGEERTACQPPRPDVPRGAETTGAVAITTAAVAAHPRLA